MGDPVLTAIMMALRLGIGLILLRLALRGSRNLHWLAACFYLNFLVLFLTAPNLRLVSQTVLVVIQVCLAMFTHATFYRNRRSPIVWVVGVILASGGLALYLVSQAPSSGGFRLLFVTGGANWAWHALVAWQARRKLLADRSIEDWIKARYAIIVAYATLMAVIFVIPLLPLTAGRTVFFRWVWPVTMMVSVVLQYLAWGMPGPLRRFLNRNYQAPAALGMTEDELLRAMEAKESAASGTTV